VNIRRFSIKQQDPNNTEPVRPGRNYRKKHKAKGSFYPCLRFPDLGPGHEVLAGLYARQNDFTNVKKPDLEAASQELSTEPLINLAAMIFERDPRQGGRICEKTLDSDRGLDAEWYLPGLAEYNFKDYLRSGEGF